MSKSRELHPVINFGLVPLLQLILAFLVVGLLIVLIGENPVQAVQLYVTDVLMSQVGIGQSIFYATTLIFTGMAVALAFHAGLFNIGAEGQPDWHIFLGPHPNPSATPSKPRLPYPCHAEMHAYRCESGGPLHN